MPLSRGTQIGGYAIESPLGAGGMGEVYRARDTRMGRSVALKLLPADLTADESRVRRFQQEARAASALNHPHIVAIFDTGAAGGLHYIAMELVEGRTLCDWVRAERPGVRAILEVITQVADALAAAHDAGIIHRDIKPGNLLVTPQGYAKVLDFGLAKLIEADGAPADATQTAEARLTRTGAVLGTLAYMSPEQALGRPVDARTDIFSLGAALYECVAGVRPFSGKNEIDVLYAVVNDAPPPVTKLNPKAPRELAWILDKALAKDAAERYQSMREFAADLRRLRRRLDSGESASGIVAVEPAPAQRANAWLYAAGGAAVTLVAVVALVALPAVRVRLAPAKPNPLSDVSLTQLTTDPGYEGQPTFSPDGETIAYVSDRTGNYEIFLKRISGGPDINITNNSADDMQPTFSRDGRQIAFISSREGSAPLKWYGTDSPFFGGDIWVMSAFGGNARRVAHAGNFPAWAPDGSAIYYVSGPWFRQKIYRVSAAGGEPREVPVEFGENVPSRIVSLCHSPDGRALAVETDGAIQVLSVAGGAPHAVVRGRGPAWAADSRAIIYTSTTPGKNSSLWRIPVSTVKLAATGPAEPLTVGRGWDVEAAVSRDGKAIILAARDVSFNLELLPFDAEAGRPTGASVPLTRGQQVIYFFSPSPDGRSAVYESLQGAEQHIWRVTEGAAPVQLTGDDAYLDGLPQWSPDGQTIAFLRRPVNDPRAPNAIWLTSADGSNPRLLQERARWMGWTPDSRGLVYYAIADQQLHLLDLAMRADRRLTNEPGVMPVLAVDPGGQWVVYQSTQHGNVTLRAVPISGGEAREALVTSYENYHPSLSPSGRWLYAHLDHKNLWRVPGPAQGWRAAPPEKCTNFPEAGLFLEDPKVTPDGHHLMYSHGHITADLWLLRLPAGAGLPK